MSGSGDKIDFLVCGVKKCGTSALDVYLRSHSEIILARNKEVHFFDRDEFFTGPYLDYDAYHSAFPRKPAGSVMGECTPSYIYWNDAPRRIWEYNNEMKFIVILRNPIDRAYSDWWMEHSRGNDELNFSAAIRMESDRVRSELPKQSRLHSYIDRGRYVQQLRRLWFFFGQDNVLVIRYEELRSRPRNELNRVCEFLGVSRYGTVKHEIVNSNDYSCPMNDEDRQYLARIFEFEIRQLERELGWDCADWLD